jgi:transcriptional regulator with XRE-family HTH domain
MGQIISQQIDLVNRPDDNFICQNPAMSPYHPLTFGERLKQARKAKALSQSALAKKAGISQSIISDAEKGKYLSSKASPQIADALGVSAIWLATGKGPMQLPEARQTAPIIRVQDRGAIPRSHDDSLALSPFQGSAAGVYALPVFTWTEAAMANATHHERPKTYPFPEPKEAGRLIVLIQDDDSMAANTGPSFPRGTELIIDIDGTPHPGDFVLVEGAGRAHLRQFSQDVTGEIYRPLNAQYKTVDAAKAPCLGVLIAARRTIYP